MVRRNILILSTLAVAALLWPATTYAAGGGGHGGGGHGGGSGHGGGYGAYHGGGHGGYYGGYRGGYGFYPGIGIGLYGGYGGYGGYGAGYSGGYGSGYGGYGSGYGASGAGYAPGAVTANPAYLDPAAQAPIPGQGGENGPPPPENRARILVFVPADAQVWVSGEITTPTGTERAFASPVLEPGKAYYYQVKARWMKNGKQVEQTQNVKIRANETSNVTFGN